MKLFRAKTTHTEPHCLPASETEWSVFCWQKWCFQGDRMSYCRNFPDTTLRRASGNLSNCAINKHLLSTSCEWVRAQDRTKCGAWSLPSRSLHELGCKVQIIQYKAGWATGQRMSKPKDCCPWWRLRAEWEENKPMGGGGTGNGERRCGWAPGSK